jgi:hypothetical protein
VSAAGRQNLSRRLPSLFCVVASFWSFTGDFGKKLVGETEGQLRSSDQSDGPWGHARASNQPGCF